jgi:aromatic-L-amino-acid decarboxylase
MENSNEFKEWGYKFIDYLADYFDTLEDYPVKSTVEPGSIKAGFADSAPEQAVPIAESLRAVNEKIMPGITHWQHPRFHAYFPANNSFPSILGELLTAGFGVQAMIWETSPAAAELEEVLMEWLKKFLDLPQSWHGVIQDTASTATLVALLTAREKHSKYQINEGGFPHAKFRIYCSDHAHSSIDKAVKIAGFGLNNLVHIPCNDKFEMKTDLLEQQILSDIEEGFIPLVVVAALGTTSSVAIDPVSDISEITKRYDLWLHVDAAYAGNAMILPEFRAEIGSLEAVDSFVFNPHKWMFTNFDLSAYFVKDKEALINTFSILPEYLRTHSYGRVNDYRDWGIQLGRRFRALKLWLVLQSFGTEKIRQMIREHVEMAAWFEEQVLANEDFECIVPRVLNVVVFRHIANDDPNIFNKKLLEEINSSGKMYLSHTVLDGKYAIRMVCGNTRLQQHHVESSWKQIVETAKKLT